MEGNSPYITNLVNSIIGVSVLAMPYCFKQCGIVLGLCLLFCAAWLTYLSCSMLASSAYHKRKRSYEYLALSTLGPTGKFCVELSMIGLMLGTCIAFYVVIGDLSHGTVAKIVPGADPYTLRLFTIIFTALCIALPLGMMKNLSLLSYFGFCSLIFYLAFLVVVILNAASNGLLNGDWLAKVNFWRPAGVFQCLPIFSLAYACQCQLFIVYSSLEEPTVHRVEDIVFGAIRFVTIAYMSIGFFGYTTYQEAIAGNLLLNFPSNVLLDCIKMGFAMSVVLGFPLMILPCRQSIHTLIFAEPAGEGSQTNTYIPPFLFKAITLGIVLMTMTVAIAIPNVETILGLTGATMGSMICFIFPALIYEKAHAKASGNTPKFVFVLGCILLLVCTYSNLSKVTDPAAMEPVAPKVPDLPDMNLQEPIIKAEEKDLLKKPVDVNAKEDPGLRDKKEPEKPQAVAEVEGEDHRHEPPNPVEPDNVEERNEENDVANEAEAPKVEENKPVENPPVEVEKQKSQNDEIHINPAPPEEKRAVAPPDQIEDPPKPVVQEEKQNPPVERIERSPDIAKDRKAEDAEHAVLPEKPEARHADRPVAPLENKADPKDGLPLSPKIVKGDQRHDVDGRDKVVAKPALDQGSPLKAQVVSQNEVPAEKDGAKSPAHDGEDQKADDTVEEKELLEKIKEQHGMQQQLLKEQEQLIKKLEEHQDKKDQAGEEDGQGARPPETARQESTLAAEPVVGPGRNELPEKPVDAEHNSEIVNRDGYKEANKPPQEQDDKKPPELAVDGGNNKEGPEQDAKRVIAGRELLSEQNDLKTEDHAVDIGGDRVVPGKIADVHQDGRARVGPANFRFANPKFKGQMMNSQQFARFQSMNGRLPDVEVSRNARGVDDQLHPEVFSDDKQYENANKEDLDAPRLMSDNMYENEEGISESDEYKFGNNGVAMNADGDTFDGDDVISCLESDLDCWQSKSKSRELKSHNPG